MLQKFKTFQLAAEFYRLATGPALGAGRIRSGTDAWTTTLKLPAHLKDQLARAASSIALNLAEGSGKASPKDRARFFEIAYASARECQAVLILALDCPSELFDRADELGALIYTLVRRNRGA